jgi:hypothetical protein
VAGGFVVYFFGADYLVMWCWFGDARILISFKYALSHKELFHDDVYGNPP